MHSRRWHCACMAVFLTKHASDFLTTASHCPPPLPPHHTTPANLPSLQDAALTRMDLLSLALVWAACGAYIIATMAFTQKPWGPFSVPRSAFLTSRHFQHVPMLLVLLAVVSSTVGRTTSGWFGATRLTWPECGDAPPFSRVNKTWTDDCLWSSSQYKCENVCCVPGGDGSAGIVNVSQLPNGAPSRPNPGELSFL